MLGRLFFDNRVAQRETKKRGTGREGGWRERKGREKERKREREKVTWRLSLLASSQSLMFIRSRFRVSSMSRMQFPGRVMLVSSTFILGELVLRLLGKSLI